MKYLKKILRFPFDVMVIVFGVFTIGFAALAIWARTVSVLLSD